MKKDERGYIVIETIGAFLPLVLLMISILSLVNIVTVQARVHSALTQAAESVSMYSYALEVTGAADHIMKNAAHAQEVRTEIGTFTDHVDQVLNGVRSLSLNQVKDGGQALGVQVKDWVDATAQDPKQTIQLLLNYALDEGGSIAFSELMRPLVERYLSNGDLTGDEYLKAAQVHDGIEGLTFHQPDITSPLKSSTLLDSQGYLWLSVTYDVDYSFGALPLPFDPKLGVTQTVVTKAWLGGIGEGYQP